LARRAGNSAPVPRSDLALVHIDLLLVAAAPSKTMIQDSACALLSHRIEPEALTQPLQLFAGRQDTTPLQDTN